MDKAQKLSAIYATAPMDVAQKFAPPKKPVERASRFVFWAGFPFFAIGLSFFLLCWQFRCGTFLMVMGFVCMFVGLALYVKGLNMRTDAWKDMDEKLKAYRIASEKWGEQYYCFRDDIVF
ncbi:MAG TPA: hypothetical protein PKW33_21690 [Anaerolineaceae bacterium]|nr:hypothetical protein [Anaerolineaceae bacterium]HPN54222.1 hypothetical protein [Anaerolineaceae bacterium]